MHKNREGPAVFEMLNKALELAHRDNRVTEERNIKLLIAQMHVVKVTISSLCFIFYVIVRFIWRKSIMTLVSL